MIRQSTILFFFASLLLLSSGCEFMLGSKNDDTVADIFLQGKIDPNLQTNEVGYVPLLPFWDGFSNPVDIFVGYDEMVYVVDDLGVHVLDQTGKVHRTIDIPGATEVVQDRRLHTYIAGRIDIEVNGQMENLAAVYHLENTGTDKNIVFTDTLIHPFNDLSRNNVAFRHKDNSCPDEAVEFTGIATKADHTLYIARRGPKNDASSIARQDNLVLFFDKDGKNIGWSKGMSSKASNLKSAININAIATFAGPPQSLTGISNTADFLVCQNSELPTMIPCQLPDEPEYKVLWIVETFDPDGGFSYGENASLTDLDVSKADRFLYEPFRFKRPADVYIAPDESGYIFVVDSEADSLYQFTLRGFEGVVPPPTSATKKQIIASFGRVAEDSTGVNEPFQLSEPSGVCYFRKILFIADKGNNRIARYKLSTDLE